MRHHNNKKIIVLLIVVSSFFINNKNASAQIKSLPKFTFGIGPEIAIPTGSFEYSGSILGIGARIEADYNLSSKISIDLYSGYTSFLGSSKGNPGPKYKPRVFPVMPGIKYYPVPLLFISGNIGFAGIGSINEKGLKGKFAYNPSIGITLPSQKRRINISLGYMHINDSPKSSNYLDMGILVRIN